MRIEKIFISTGHDFVGRHEKGRLDHGTISLDSAECVAGSGLVGDRYFDHKENYKGQITFFDRAVLERIERDFKLENLDPTLFRRNVLSSGIDLNTLIGEKFSVQGIEFEGTEECRPCYWMDQAVAPGVHEALKGYGGLRARILTSGTLSTETA